MFAKYLISLNINNNNIIQLNFEDLKYVNMTYIELNNYIEETIKSLNGKVYLLIDEIQKIKKWELTINSLR